MRLSGDVGGHLFAEAQRTVEVAGHFVEGLRQFADLVARTDGDLFAERAARHVARGAGEFAEGARDAARKQNADDQREQSCADGAGEDGTIESLEKGVVHRRGRHRFEDEKKADDFIVHYDGDAVGHLRFGELKAGRAHHAADEDCAVFVCDEEGGVVALSVFHALPVTALFVFFVQVIP